MSAAGWAAAALWGLAVALTVRPGGLPRLRAREGRTRLPVWTRGHPGGLEWRLRLTLGLAAAALVSLLLGVPALLVPVAAVVAGIPVAVLLGKLEPPAAKRRTVRLQADLPQVCDLLAACLDAGLPLREAARAVSQAVGGPLGRELARVAAQTALGVADADAWRSLTHPVLVRLGKDLGRAAEAGTVSSRHLRMHAVEATGLLRAAREEAARKVGVQSVLPLMACFLPAFLLLGIVPIVGGFVATLFG
ncbi:type II secretion system F family protein [Propionicicella superfundia]|uniref:type II secretion system F family protein n=1 Tax=Propionicicella superfundia TaxID=348582 RepID=UPI0012EC4988|nr:type II secretion system F family protein [Propionicicella superfundia]